MNNVDFRMQSHQTVPELENRGNLTYSWNVSPPCYDDAIQMPKPKNMCYTTAHKTPTAMPTVNP